MLWDCRLYENITCREHSSPVASCEADIVTTLSGSHYRLLDINPRVKAILRENGYEFDSNNPLLNPQHVIYASHLMLQEKHARAALAELRKVQRGLCYNSLGISAENLLVPPSELQGIFSQSQANFQQVMKYIGRIGYVGVLQEKREK